MSLASNLNLDMRWLHPTAWVYWQVLDGWGWGLVSGFSDSTTLSHDSIHELGNRYFSWGGRKTVQFRVLRYLPTINNH